MFLPFTASRSCCLPSSGIELDLKSTEFSALLTWSMPAKDCAPADLIPLPYSATASKYLPFAQHFAEFNAWFWVAAGVQADLTTGRLDFASLANAHDSWAARVKAAIPQERLLVHNAKQGFAPLCGFLDVPPERCPSKYPHVNDGATLSFILDIAEGLVIVLQIVVVSLPILILWFAMRKMTSTGQHNKEHGQKKAN